MSQLKQNRTISSVRLSRFVVLTSVAFLQSAVSMHAFSSPQPVDWTQVMQILSVAEKQGLDSTSTQEQVNEFLSGFTASESVKDMVKSYQQQGLKASDYKPLGNGRFYLDPEKIKEKFSGIRESRTATWSGNVCMNASPWGNNRICVPEAGQTCTVDLDTNHC